MMRNNRWLHQLAARVSRALFSRIPVPPKRRRRRRRSRSLLPLSHIALASETLEPRQMLSGVPPQYDPITDPNLTTDEDSGIQDVTVSGITSNDSPTQPMRLEVSALGAQEILDFGGGIFPVSGNSATFSYTPLPNQSGDVEVIVRLVDSGLDYDLDDAEDNESYIGETTITIRVESQNDPPKVDPISDQWVPQDTPPYDISVTGLGPGGGLDEEDQVLTITPTWTSNPPGLISSFDETYISPNAEGTITFQPAPGLYGEADVTLTVRDEEGGEAETTFTIHVVPIADYGDAPAPYPVEPWGENVALHLDAGPMLGSLRDVEIGAHSADASGDGADEDGVQFGPIRAGDPSAYLTLDVSNVSQTAYVDAWIDFVGDGTWGSTDRLYEEQIVVSAPVQNGSHTFRYAVPAWAASGTSYARVRVSSAGGLGPRGQADDGEVEDYQVEILAPVPTNLNFWAAETVAEALGTPATQAVVEDFDGDGQKDLVVGYSNGTQTDLYLHTLGEGGDVPPRLIAQNIIARISALSDPIDVDQDGDWDLIVNANRDGSSGFGRYVLWLENDGEGNFTEHVLPGSLTSSTTLEFQQVDFDGDGVQDLIGLGTPDGWPITHSEDVWFFKNDGSENFTLTDIVGYAGTDNYPDLALGDFDGDGDPDLAWNSGGENPVHQWWENSGDGSGQTLSLSQLTGELDEPVLADMDGDTDLDAVGLFNSGGMFGFDSGFVYLENNGNGSFTTYEIDAAHNDSFRLEDLDGDGDLDVILSDGSFGVAWYENRGGGDFVAREVADGPASDHYQSVGAGDVDDDGDLDLWTVSTYNVKLWLNDGSENFSPENVNALAAGAGRVVRPTDLDRDGDLDLVVLDASADRIDWYENQGDESFVWHAIATNDFGQTSIRIVDYNRDGHLDVLGTRPSYEDADQDGSNDTYYAISWNGDGAGEFSFRFTYLYEDLFSWPDEWHFHPDANYQLPGVDIDMVGGWDLWSDQADTKYPYPHSGWDFGGGSTFLPVGLHQPDGSYDWLSDLSTSFDASEKLYLDFDGDGDLDVLGVFDNWPYNIGWLEHDGQLDFTKHTIATGSKFGVGDLDGDGDLDIYNHTDWYETRPDMSFVEHPFGVTLSGSLQTVDFDGDGDADIMTEGYASGERIWLKNDGAGNFTQELLTDTIAVTSSHPAHLVDVNRDGTLDWIRSSNYALEWHPNPINPPPTLDPLSPLVLSEDDPEQGVALSGISSGLEDVPQELRVTAWSNNQQLFPDATLNIDYVSAAATGTLRFAPQPDAFGEATITVQVEDEGPDGDINAAADNGIVTQQMSVTVTEVNDPPTIAILEDLTLPVDAGEQVYHLLGLNLGTGEAGGIYAIAAGSDNPALIPTIGPVGSNDALVFTPAAGQLGTATVTFTVEDAGLDGDPSTRGDNAIGSFEFDVNVIDPWSPSPDTKVATLDPIPDPPRIEQDAPLQTVVLSGVSPGAGETGSVWVEATSSNAALIPDPWYTNNAIWQQLSTDIDGEAAEDWSGYSVSLSSDGTTVAIGAPYNDGNGDDSGHTRIYTWDGSAWNQLGSDIDGETAVDGSGVSVSLSSDGTTVAIGAIDNDGNGNASGHTRIYTWDGSAWNQLGSDIDGEAAEDGSGYSVSLSSDGTTVAIGAHWNDGNGNESGHTRIYTWDGSAWNQLGTDIDGEAAVDWSGYSVSLSSDGTTVAIGANANDGNGDESGHTRIYTWDGSAWNQLGTDIDGEAAWDDSGYSVSLSSDGTTVAIGAPYNDGNGNLSGHTRIYTWDGSAWDQLGSDIDGEAAVDLSGVSVSLSSDGTTVAIGAHWNDGNGDASGHTRIYTWDGSAWNQLGTDIDGEAAVDQSGYSVSLSSDGTTVAIGAITNDGNGNLSGHTRIFQLYDSSQITYRPEPGVVGTATITVQSEDAGDDDCLNTRSDNRVSAPQSFDVIIDGPPVMEDQVFSVAENSLDGAVVGTLTATDPNGDAISYSITVNEGDSGAAFRIEGDQLLVNNPGDLDFEADPQLVITVEATDGGLSDTAQITIDLTDVPEAPTLSPIADMAIGDSSGAHTVSLSGITAGGGESQTLQVTATSNNPGLIPNPQVNYTSPGTAGSLVFSPVLLQSGTATITVTVEDAGPDGNLATTADNLSVSETFDVVVTMVDQHPPVFENQSLSITENSPAGTLVGTLEATDLDGDLITYSIISNTDPDGDGLNAFSLNGDELKVLDPGDLDFETDPQLTITVGATDVSGSGQINTAQVTVDVLNIAENDSGTVTIEVQWSDPQNLFTPDEEEKIADHVKAAGYHWTGHFNLVGSPDSTIEVVIAPDEDPNALASALSVAWRSYFGVVHEGAPYEMITGDDPNLPGFGGNHDVEINVNPLRGGFDAPHNDWYFEPDPWLPAGQIPAFPLEEDEDTDLMSTLLHEWGHALGFFSGYQLQDNFDEFGLPGQDGRVDDFLRAGPYANFYAPDVGAYDRWVNYPIFEGDYWYFEGANARSEYGGSVPLYSPWDIAGAQGSAISHVGNPPPEPGSVLSYEGIKSDLMYFEGYPGPPALNISGLDLAILEDLGYSIQHIGISDHTFNWEEHSPVGTFGKFVAHDPYHDIYADSDPDHGNPVASDHYPHYPHYDSDQGDPHHLKIEITDGNLNIDGDENPAFRIEGHRVVVNDQHDLDYETNPVFVLELTATDGTVDNFGNPIASTGYITINLSDIDETPVFVNQDFNIAENSSHGAHIGTFAGRSPAGYPITYTIVSQTHDINGDGNGAYEVVGNQLIVNDPYDFNYEILDTMVLSVVASTTSHDGTIFSVSATITVNITDVDDDDFLFSIYENSAKGTFVGFLPASTATYSFSTLVDPDGDGNPAFSLYKSDRNALTYIFVNDPGDLDYEDSGLYHRIFNPYQASDGSVLDTATIYVKLLDVRETPLFDYDTFNIAENPVEGGVVGWFSDFAATYTIIGNNPDADADGKAAFRIVKSARNSVSYLLVNDADEFNYETAPVFNLFIEAMYDAHPDTPTTGQAAVSLTNVIEPPRSIVPGGQLVEEDDHLLFAASRSNTIYVIDEEAGSGVVMALSASDGTLTFPLLSGLTILAGSNGSGAITFSGSVADVNIALEGLKYTPTSDYSGAASVDVVFRNIDGPRGSTQYETVAITVNPVNDAPAALALANRTSSLAEDTDTTTALKVADLQITDDGVGSNTVSLTGSDAASFEVVGTELVLKAGEALNYDLQTSYAVTVNVADSTVAGSTPLTETFVLSILDVNRAPTAVVLTNTVSALAENADTSSHTKVADIQVTDDTAGSNTLSLSGADAASFEVVGTELVLKAGEVLDYESQGSYSVTVHAEDSTVSGSTPATAAYTLGLSDVNEAPTGVVLANAVSSLLEGTDTSSRVKVADIQITGDALGTNEITLSGSDMASFEVDGTELYLKAGTALDFATKDRFAVTVNVEDSSLAGSTPVTAELVLAITLPGSANLSVFAYDASANQLMGGTFEGSPVGSGSWGHVAAISGWTSANGVEVWGEGFANYITSGRAGSGSRGQIVELDYYGGGALDWIEQGIASSAGAEYLVLVDVLSRTGSGVSDDMELSWNGTVFDTAHTSELAGQSWQSYGGLVTGSGGTDALRLAETAASNDGYGPVIDNARVYQVTSPAVDEGLPGGTVVTNIHLSTVDGVAYTNLRLSNDAGGLFTLDADTGVIRTTRSLDFDSDPSSYQIVVAVDTAEGTLTKTLGVGLNAINEAPTSLALVNTVTTLSEAADTSSRIKLADLQITDDALGTNDVTLSGADAASFEVDGTELFLKAGTGLDRDSQASYAVTVTVEDSTVSGSTPVTDSLTLSITEVNLPPTGVVLANAVTTLAENADTSSRVKVADIQISDDALGSNAVSLTGADAASFEVVGTELFLKAGTALDYETQSSYAITVNVEDSSVAGSTPVTAAYALGLGDVNEAPTGVVLANTVTSLAENSDTSSRVKVADIQITDDALGTNEITLSGPDAASFEVDGTELFLKAGTALDYESQASYSVTVNAGDSSVAGSTPVTAAYTLGLGDVNEAPTGVVLANAVTTLAENADTSSRVKVADLQITDDALGTNEITLTGSDAASFEVIGSELFLKAGTVLDFALQTSYSVTVNVEDSSVAGSTPVTASLTLSITELNLPPTNVGVTITNPVVAEDTDTSVPIEVGDIVILDDGVGVNTITLSGPDAASFEVVGLKMYHRAGFPFDYETQIDYFVTVNVADTALPGSVPVEASVLLSLTDVNEAPTDVALANTVTSLAEDTDTTSAIKLADIQISDDALGANTVSLSGADAASFEAVGTELVLKAGTGLDFTLQTSYSVTVNVEDSWVAGSTPVTVGYTLAITNVNESPSGTVVISGTATEDQVLTASNNLTDGDGLGAISYQWRRDGGDIGGATSSTYTLTQEDVGSQITVTASYTDGGGTAESVTSDPTSAVADVNDAPTGVVLANAATSLPEDTDTTSAVKLADIVIADDGHAGSNNAITLSGSDAASFEVVGTELHLKAGTALDFALQASYSVTVNVEDSTVSGSTPVTTELVLAITSADSANLSVFAYDTSADQLVNGAFEGSGVSNNSWGHVAAISGWSSSNGVEVWGEGFANYTTSGRAGTGSRGQVVELDYYGSGALDWIEQGVATGAGAEYLVLVDVLSRTGSGASDDMELSWNGTVFDTAHTSELAGQSWQSYGGLVTGSGGTDALRLAETAASNDGYGPVIDNARVYQATSPTVDEGLPGGTVVTNVHVRTVDGVAYTNLRLSHDAGGLFTLDADTGVIRTTRSLDFDSDPSSYQLTVAVDTAGGTLTKNLSVELKETNQAPTAVTLVNTVTTLSEGADTSSRVKLADIQITDDALGTNDVTLSGSDAGSFEVVGMELFLKAGTGLDRDSQASYSVTVNVEDSSLAGSTPVTVAHTLAITDVNEAPTDVALANTVTALAEDTDTTSAVKLADIVISDDGHAGSNNVISLSGADAASFEVVGSELFLAAGTGLDRDTQASYSVTVNVEDSTVSGSTPVTVGYTLGITNVNELPSGAVVISGTATEDETLTASNTLADADGLGAISYHWNRDGSAIDGATGSTYTLTQEDVGSQITVTASYTDGEGTAESVTSDPTSAVADINDAPTGVVLANTVSSLPEDTDTTSAVKLADIVIADDGHAGSNNAITLSGSDAASFEVIGTELYLKAGTVLDRDSQVSYSVTVNVEDSTVSGSTPVTAELVLAITPPGSANLSLFTYDTSANQLVNGAFEGSPVSNNSWGHVAAISGWTSSNGVEVWGEGFANYATSGRAGTGSRGQLVELDYYGSGALDWLEQGVATGAGAEYLVLVDVLSRTGSGVSDDMELSWNGTVFDTAHTSELAGQSWQSYGGLVTGSGGTDALRLAETAASNDGYGPVIDNARVYQATSPTVDEGLPGETVVTNIHLSTVDGVAYTNLRLSNDAGGLFTLDADTGVIRTTRSLDFDSDPSSYQLTVAVDTAGGTLTKNLNVGLNDITTAPRGSAYRAMQQASQEQGFSRASLEATPAGRSLEIASALDYATHVSDTGTLSTAGSTVALSTVTGSTVALSSPGTADLAFGSDDLEDIFSALEDDWQQAFGGEGENPFTGF